MERSGRRKQQRQEQVHQQQHGAGRKSCRVSAMVDICLTCLKDEEWCFAIGEVGYVAPDQPPPCQVREEPEHPAPMWEEDGPEQEPEDEGSVHPQPKRGEAERPQPKAPLAGEEYLLVHLHHHHRGGPPCCNQTPVGESWGTLGGLGTATAPIISPRHRSHGAQLPGCGYERGPTAV
ncbi:UNVERIFIED_CONTAM: hypothetical protein FKN15_071565 [Acipenser sinensis]